MRKQTWQGKPWTSGILWVVKNIGKTMSNRVSDFKDFRVPAGARVVAFCCTQFWNVGDCCYSPNLESMCRGWSKNSRYGPKWKCMQSRSKWWFQLFYFHPYLGKWSNLTNIFQVGWNHQLEIHACMRASIHTCLHTYSIHQWESFRWFRWIVPWSTRTGQHTGGNQHMFEFQQRLAAFSLLSWQVHLSPPIRYPSIPPENRALLRAS